MVVIFVERKVFVVTRALRHVPLQLSQLLPNMLPNCRKSAQAKSVMGDIICSEREGLVYKCNERELSFKAISNKFLLKYGG